MIKKFQIVVLILIIFQNPVFSATVLNDSWSNVVSGKSSDQTTGWWSSAEALRITENVFLYQKDCGGWPKNINMQLVLTDAEKAALIADKPKNTEATMDNGACRYELLYLSKVNAAVTDTTLKRRIRTAFLNGINYYIKSQYANGGWPQFFPIKKGYYTHITFNDDAIYNVLVNLRHVYSKDSYYSVIAPDSIVNKAKIAFDKGVQCILKCQYVQKFKLTSWCAQHDENTFLPAQARAYELPSLSGYESSGLINLLTSLQNPSKEIKRAVYSSVYWYNKARIKGIRLESFTNTDGLSDKRVVADPTASDLWARFYTLADNRPFFCDRDGIMKFSLAEIGYERRNGYSWYNTSGTNVATYYSNWLPKWGTSTLISPLPGSQIKNTDTIPVIGFVNKYKGSAVKKVALILNSTVYKTFSGYAIDTTFTGLKGGNYTMILNAEFSNGQTESDTVQFTVLGENRIEDIVLEGKLMCYMNSKGNGFTIKSDGFIMQHIDIYNISGKIIKSYNPESSLFSNDCYLPEGIYIVKATDFERKLYTQKLIINRF